MRQVRRHIFSALLLAGLLTLDLGSKVLAETWLRGKGVVRLAGDLLVLVYAENHGAFLSLGSGASGPLWYALFVFLPAAMVLGILVMYLRERESAALRLAYVLIAAGGAGNLWDRVLREGYVRDFINAGIGGLRTGVLNIADLYVTAGVVIVFVLATRKPKEGPAA